MSILYSQQTDALIERIINETSLQEQTVDHESFSEFVRHYYYGVPYEELSIRDLFDLRGAAKAHFELGRKRVEHETKIRIYMPDVERDGWRSKHAVLEIVSTDRPFLVDSISMILKNLGYRLHLLIHPVFVSKRDETGNLAKIASPQNADFLDSYFESFLHLEFDKPSSVSEFDRIRQELLDVLNQIEVAVEDWPTMRSRMQEATENLEREISRPGAENNMEDYPQFCNWLRRGNFTLLGYCEYEKPKNGEVKLVDTSTLGVLRLVDSIDNLLPSNDFKVESCSGELIITKANAKSTIHRDDHMDLIAVPIFNEKGHCSSVRIIVGLLGSTAYNSSAELIPLLRIKIKRVLERSRFSETTHSSRVLTNIIDNYPRDMLFRVTVDELYEDVAGTLELQDRQRVRLFLRREKYGRFYSALVYIPHELFGRPLRVGIEKILMKTLKGKSSDFIATFSGSVLARINYTIYVDPGSKSEHTLEEIQQLVEHAATTWQDALRQAAYERYGEDIGQQYFRLYGAGFSASYQEDHTPWVAAADLERLDGLDKINDLKVSFYCPLGETDSKQLRFRLYSYAKQVSPSDVLPVLENMGLRVVRENPYHISTDASLSLWVYDYVLQPVVDGDLNSDDYDGKFEDAFISVWFGKAENDEFNRLVLAANLSWKQVSVLRAYSRYLKQIGSAFSDSYITETLIRNLDMTKHLVKYFELRFDPQVSSSEKQQLNQRRSLQRQLEAVTSLDEDVILGSLLNAISSTNRTNFFCINSNNQALDYISFKIDCKSIRRMPEPRPMYEIFVYSPRTEAIHLRGGLVARGGLRWSDRREDFRTEVLGLVKAQMVKNSVIVPVGSKGGFVVKQPPPLGSTMLDEGIHCYSTMICGMLDLTDNIVDGKIVSPANVRCYDGEDPYLVVAADKGTATFSDIANALSAEYGFWLDDAFASGGSVGYDHKSMGITARGAWESVKRHFRELGTNIQETNFTVVGIGDMSGDVFGNGMLLSKYIQLIGAFNHIEIFLDPNPDVAKSFAERRRLFENPRLTWKDYDKSLISAGGGVFDRNAKAIQISQAVQKRLRITAKKLTPNELMHAMLKAPVDLLWNGGIGTYVKASSESHVDAANRSNDLIRVNGNELGAKVVGEGGNLGMTQLGRIEYCMHGGRCYTDSIDNSGGVDCSDHEVNIKILLNQVVNDGELTSKQREKILRDMTDEVAELVLQNNYQQSQALSLLNVESKELLREHARYIQDLEKSGELNREIEYLPNREEIKLRESKSIGLRLPELSVLLSYSKMTLYQRLLKSNLPEDDYLSGELEEYFPKRLSKRFRDEMNNHQLRREIIVTCVTNDMVNRVGPSFAFRMHQITSAKFANIARAYCAVVDIFEMKEVWTEIEGLDNVVPASSQMIMLKYAQGLLERASLWLLRHRNHPINIKETVNYYRPDMLQLAEGLSTTLSKEYTDSWQQQIEGLIKCGVSSKLAQRIIEFIPLSTAFDIIEIIKSSKKPVEFVSQVYFDIGARLGLIWIREQVATLPIENHWHGLARSRLRDNIHSHQYDIANDAVVNAKTNDPNKAVSDWMETNRVGCRMLANIIADMKTLSRIDFATLTVAISEVHLLGRSTE